MTAHLDPFAVAPEAMSQWLRTAHAFAGLDPTLIGLVEIRASQINGCANCINMHAADARARGESEQRIYLLSAGGIAVLRRARARGARLDRGADPAFGRAPAGTGPRGAAGAVL